MTETKLHIIMNEEIKNIMHHLEVLDVSDNMQLREFLKTMIEHKIFSDAIISIIDRMIESKFTLDETDFTYFKGGNNDKKNQKS